MSDKIEELWIGPNEKNRPLRFGGVGSAGDFLIKLVLQPEDTSPGSVVLTDGASGKSFTIFHGGENSIAFWAEINCLVMACSESGAWHVTTGERIAVRVRGIARPSIVRSLAARLARRRDVFLAKLKRRLNG